MYTAAVMSTVAQAITLSIRHRRCFFSDTAVINTDMNRQYAITAPLTGTIYLV